MPRANVPLLSFGGGEVSRLALGRIDLDRLQMCGETVSNWILKSVGPISIRPGTGYLGSSDDNEEAQWLPFVASTNDTALIEITDGATRIWIDDALLTNASVATTVTNGDFSSGTGWTLTSAGGGTSSISGGVLTLDTIVLGSIATASRLVTVGGADQNVEHALRIVITRGPVNFRVGTTAGAQNYIAEQKLGTGEHSLRFTPTGDFYVWFGVRSPEDRIVDSIQIEAAGTVGLPGPWAAADLDYIKADQSGDVVFVACLGYAQRQYERRLDGRSWSLVFYESLKGPFFSTGTKRIKVTSSVSRGNGTLTASSDLFTADWVGGLVRMWHEKQDRTVSLAGEDEYTYGLVIRGEGSPARDIERTSTGTWVGTLTAQYTLDGENWAKNQEITNKEGWIFLDDGTINATGTVAVPGDNITSFVRAGFLPGDYTSGTVTFQASYGGASGIAGIARVTGYTSTTVVDIEVIHTIWSTATSTKQWEEGIWSPLYGYPSATELHEGRLWWAGGARLFGSYSDDYNNFDADAEGDAAPIVRLLGEGPVDAVNWLLGLDGGLLMGTDGGVLLVRSSNFGEPLTPADSTVKPVTTQGASNVQAVKIDNAAVYIHGSGARAYGLLPTGDSRVYDSNDMNLLHPDILSAGVVGMDVQRQPDTRIHMVLDDGTVAIFTYEPKQEVAAWSRFETDGFVEKVVVLPGTDEDQVYYHVRRVIGGVTKRFLEKWAKESECVSGTLCKLLDSFVTWSGASSVTITGLSHLEGETVRAWAGGVAVLDADGEPEEFTVASGQITLPSAVTSAVVGLGYNADFKSTKLAYAAAMGTALNQRKRINELGIYALDLHNRSLKFGRDFDNLQGLPRVLNEADVTANQIFDELDVDMFAFGGDWGVDSRICIRAQAPLPATLAAVTFGMSTHDRG